MSRLLARSPCAEALPITIGACRLEDRTPDVLTWVADLGGGGDLPGPGATGEVEGHRALWFGPGQALVFGSVAARDTLATADHSDAWVLLHVSGASARMVLARLTPLDLRPAAFAIGQTARTLLGHITASLTPVPGDGLELLVPRSMAATAIHDLERAMRMVAARDQGAAP